MMKGKMQYSRDENRYFIFGRYKTDTDGFWKEGTILLKNYRKYWL